MAKHYKDFNKEVKDMLTKNYETPGEWKIENKTKCKEDKTFWINPKADKKGISADVEFNYADFDLKSKTNVTASNIAPKVTYEKSGHKVEVGVDKLAADAAYTVEYEGTLAGFKIHDKLTKKDLTCGVGYKVAPHCQVGAAVTIGLAKGVSLSSWSAGTRYLDDAGRQLTVSTKDLKSYTTGVIYPLPDVAMFKKVKLAAQVDCHHGGATWMAGVEFPCVLKPCEGTWKLKINEKYEASVAFILKMNDNWKMALSSSFADCCKIGASFTRE